HGRGGWPRAGEWLAAVSTAPGAGRSAAPGRSGDALPAGPRRAEGRPVSLCHLSTARRGAVRRLAWRPAPLDLALCAGLVIGAFVYLSRWPHDLYGFDEGLFLYEAKRIRDGEVPYRDFFEIVTPGAWYVMALVFRLFGTTMEATRSAMAVVHGLIVAAVFVACRTRSVRVGLAVAAAVAHLGIGYP